MPSTTCSSYALLATRRSVKPRDLVTPGPDAEGIARILTVASRVPDHGKLAPWRFVVIADRNAFATLLHDAVGPAARAGETRATSESAKSFAMQAPVLIALLYAPNLASAIPAEEQHLSVGASGFALLAAAQALGYAGAWLTGWPARSESVRAALAGKTDRPDARIAGFFYLGTAKEAPTDRPRPHLADIVGQW